VEAGSSNLARPGAIMSRLGGGGARRCSVHLLPCCVLVNKLFLVRRVVVCPSGALVMMFFSAASARVWGLVSGCVLVWLLTWLCVKRRERERETLREVEMRNVGG
jgi:hypothetical protein